MKGSSWAAVLGGVVAGALVATAIERVHRSRLADVEAQLAVVDQKLREVAPVRAQIDAFEAGKAHLEAQVRWIEEERKRQRCPAAVLADLALESRPLLVDAMALDGTTLAIVGRADSEPDATALADSVRQASWARAVRASRTSGRASGGKGLRFGLLATIEQPPCRAPQSPAPAPMAER